MSITTFKSKISVASPSLYQEIKDLNTPLELLNSFDRYVQSLIGQLIYLTDIPLKEKLALELRQLNILEPLAQNLINFKIKTNNKNNLKINNSIKDPIVNQVVNKYLHRSSFGINKYGLTLQDNPADFIVWLNHLQEELMDATLYIQKLKTLEYHTIDLPFGDCYLG